MSPEAIEALADRIFAAIEAGDAEVIADLPAALFVEVAVDQVTRIDEYLDGVGIAAAFGQ